MDSITQAVLGASIQGAMLGRWQGRRALLYGAMLGTLPDMDVVLNYGDAVANMTFHRGFSHSLLVVGLLSLVLTWLVSRFRPHPSYSANRLWLCIWLVLTTHILLDAFTTYGTQLFWPLPTPPVAISSIFIIDPLYSLPLLFAVLAALVVGLKRAGLRLQYAALLVSTLYLASTLVGKQMAEHRLDQALAAAGIQADSRFSSPTPFNTVLWRVVAVQGDDYYEGLVSWFDNCPPELEKLPRRYSEAQAALGDSPQHQRLRWFTGDLLRYDLLDGQWVVTDLRLGMTGYHPFRFALAHVESGDEDFHLIDAPELWPTPGADLSGLAPLARRAFNQHYPISLAHLAEGLSLAPNAL